MKPGSDPDPDPDPDPSLRDLIRAGFRGALRDDDVDTLRGGLYRRVADLDFALRAGVTITLDEILREEFMGLRILHHERDVYERETMERDSSMSKPPKWSNVG